MREDGGRFPQLEDLSREEIVGLLQDAAKNWLAHDGIWFQAVEQMHGMEDAIRADTEAWRRFTVVEAKRIMRRHGIEPGGGIPALVKALPYRLYAYINVQDVVAQTDTRVVFRMLHCRVQSARKRGNLPDFPCKSVGLVEYGEFAKTIDPRLRTSCIYCPPDGHPDDVWCAWEFTVEESDKETE
ncbi:MAG: hypothetical protein JSU73_04945 [candidate division WOR-3 bacterium]|nr:MAG: hypothetical protein JSU73_04945 [candidate division WOR-3 bacterium]